MVKLLGDKIRHVQLFIKWGNLGQNLAEDIPMFDETLFIIAVYCVIDEVYRQLFPDGVRHRGFAPT
jgi:phage terminase small subunit